AMALAFNSDKLGASGTSLLLHRKTEPASSVCIRYFANINAKSTFGLLTIQDKELQEESNNDTQLAQKQNSIDYVAIGMNGQKLQSTMFLHEQLVPHNYWYPYKVQLSDITSELQIG